MKPTICVLPYSTRVWKRNQALSMCQHYAGLHRIVLEEFFYTLSKDRYNKSIDNLWAALGAYIDVTGPYIKNKQMCGLYHKFSTDLYRAYLETYRESHIPRKGDMVSIITCQYTPGGLFIKFYDYDSLDAPF